MISISERNIKVIDNASYINQYDFYTYLNILKFENMTYAKNHFMDVCNDFNIRTVMDDDKNTFYRLEDVESAYKEATEYYNNYYTSDQVYLLCGRYAFRYIDVTPSIIVPPKYKNVLYKTNNLCSIDDINKLLDHLKLTRNIDCLNFDHSPKYINNDIYISPNDVVDILDIQSGFYAAFNTLEKDWKPRTIKEGGIFTYYNKSDIEKIKDNIISFLETFYSREQAISLLLTRKYLKNFTPISIGNKYRRFFQSTYNRNSLRKAYIKSDIDGFLYDFNNNYASKEEVMEILNLSSLRFKQYLKEYKFNSIKLSEFNIRYSKKDIYKILEKRKAYNKEFISSTECESYFNDNSHKLKHLSKLEKHLAPLYMCDKTLGLGGAQQCYTYKRDEFFKLLDKVNKLKLRHGINNIECDSLIETYNARLNSLDIWEGFDSESIYTSKKWFDYIQSILNTSRRNSERGRNALINSLVYSTLELKEYFLDTNKKVEIYSLSTNQANMSLRILSTYTYTKIIYNFLKEVHSDMRAINNTTTYKGFNFLGLDTPDKIWESVKREGSDEIYSFDIYSTVFDYCTDVKLHTRRAIAEVKKKNNCTYASSWLYSILHLNNAWRHGDVINFPQLNIQHILNKDGIYDLDWFKDNEISLPSARAVIHSVNQWELKVSKTQVKGCFFCSDELAPAFATSVIILTLSNASSISTNYENSTSESLMNFGTTYNDITSSMLKRFFNKINLENFEFGSRKFNKTVMTYIYYISNLSGDAKALLYAMKLRAHLEKNTTGKHYLKLNESQVAELGKQLFMRGEFGFVSSLLIQKLNHGELSFDETTKAVYDINHSFGDLVQVNTTVAFMNTLRKERLEVYKAINEMSFKQLQEFSTDLFARKAPCKDCREVQCLFYKKGCQRPDLQEKGGCYECPNHIPTIYALDTICESIKYDIKIYKKTDLLTEKFRLSQSIQIKKQHLISAIEKYGPDYVYGCLGYSNENFLLIMATIDKPDAIRLDLANNTHTAQKLMQRRNM